MATGFPIPNEGTKWWPSSFDYSTLLLLYDTTEKRAWLVPDSEVILHMVQYLLGQDPAIVNEQPVKLSLTAVARSDLTSNAAITIEEGYTFENAVKST
ncbi:unnamed protein product [Clonostachys solani]|uniref:Uncharacterized protein n=1 Tax=Clonostachys solani TaxID=160281 RepID=A0A9N9W595_9HYPO|nr:unnamed protein product [Clonostachys solani]